MAFMLMVNTNFNLNYRENSLFTEKILLKKFLLKLPPFSADITEDANSKGSRMPGSTA